MRFHFRINEPPTLGESSSERWEGPDGGLLCAWLRGIEKAQEDPELAAKCKAGELPVFGWKGGIAKPIKSKSKIGSLLYLAKWYGMRGEDLEIDTATEPRILCSRTGVTVTFTSNTAKLLEAPEEDE